MCVVSNVYDYWGPKIPQPPAVYPTVIHNPPAITPQEVEELKKLIKEFKEAVAIARRLDELMSQSDCVDPDKAKLEDRVKKIEDWIEKIKQ